MSEKCGSCDGCGKVANTRRVEPWSAWLNLPAELAAAVTAGIVRPKTCPACNGSGVKEPGLWTQVLPDPASDHLAVMRRADLEAIEWSGLYLYDWREADHACCPACHGLKPGGADCRHAEWGDDGDDPEVVYEDVEHCPLNYGNPRPRHGHQDRRDGRRCPVDRALRPTAAVNPES